MNLLTASLFRNVSSERLYYFSQVLFLSALVGHGISVSKIYFFHVCYLLGVVYILKNDFIGVRAVILTPVMKLFSFVLLWLLVLSVINYQDEETIKHAIYWFIKYTTILMFVAYFNKFSINRYVNIIIGFTVIVYLIGIVETVVGIHWPISKWVGLSCSQDLLGECVWLKYRPTTFFYAENTSSIFIILGLPFLLTVRLTLFKILSISIAAYLIIIADSRAAFMAFLVIILLWAKFDLKRYFIIIISAVVLTIMLFTSKSMSPLSFYKYSYNAANDVSTLNKPDSKKINLKGSGYDSSESVRIKLINAALRKNIFLGEGAGGSILRPHNKIFYSEKKWSLHLYWLEVLVDAGIVGIGYIGLVLYLIANLYLRNKDDFDCQIDKAISLSLLGVFISALGSGSIVYFMPYWIILSFAIYRLGKFKSHKDTIGRS